MDICSAGTVWVRLERAYLERLGYLLAVGLVCAAKPHPPAAVRAERKALQST